jgi:N-acetylglucosaminyl-diphospho-decaprenol L-rhamnosyltransferase
MRVAAIVVSHGHAAELETTLPALAAQVDELVVVANIPGSVAAVPDATRILANERPLGFAANANQGIAATDTELVLVANPDAVPAADAVTILRRFMEEHPRCGIAGPQLRYPDGRWQPSRRAFPTVGATLVRRTPLRLLFPAFERQRKHYLLDERPTEPAASDWLLGAFLLLRRSMLDEIGGFDAGMRMYVEDMELSYRAAKAGWERWYVPAAEVEHAYDAAIDRRLLTRRNIWHARSMLRFLRRHPERLRALW